MQTLTSRDGVTLSYRSFGAGPTTVLLIHGWMASGAVYDDLIEALNVGALGDPRLGLTRERLRFIVPDLRGTGGSAASDGGYSIAQYADDVLAVADAVRATSFVVVGHSMGGQIAQWIAATSPDRVLGAALLCPVPASGLSLPPEAREFFRSSGGSRDAQGKILDMATTSLPAAARERLLDHAGKIPVACIQQAFDAWTTGGFADKLGSIRAPTLVVATDDGFLPHDLLRKEIVAAIPKADLVYLPGAGHYVQVERPRETAAVLRGFLLGLEGAAQRR